MKGIFPAVYCLYDKNNGKFITYKDVSVIFTFNNFFIDVYSIIFNYVRFFNIMWTVLFW